MKTTARPALAKHLQMHLGGFSPAEVGTLHRRLAMIGKKQVETYLRASSVIGLGLAASPNRRALRSNLVALEGLDDLLTRYAATAWAARALVLAELLDRFDPDLPQKWAAEATLLWLSEFESEEVWLWPFGTEPPWPNSADEDMD